MSYFRLNRLSRNKELQAYVVGLAMGDGNLSNPNGRATRLRITCDLKYPNLIDRIKDSLARLFPDNKIGSIVHGKGAEDIYVYSNSLEELLGWKANGGPKHMQNISMPSWIQARKSYKINYLRGLIETDGSIYSDRGYKMVIFSTIIKNLADNFYGLVKELGFNPHIYKIPQPKSSFGHKFQVRLSKDVFRFLKIVKPNKS